MEGFNSYVFFPLIGYGSFWFFLFKRRALELFFFICGTKVSYFGCGDYPNLRSEAKSTFLCVLAVSIAYIAYRAVTGNIGNSGSVVFLLDLGLFFGFIHFMLIPPARWK